MADPSEDRGDFASVNPFQPSVKISEIQICRICRLGEEECEEPLRVTGCQCRGSVRYCHQSCIQTWANHQRHLACELCGFKFKQLRLSPGIKEETALPRGSHEEFDPNDVALVDEESVKRFRSWFILMLVVSTIASISASVVMARLNNYIAAISENTTFVLVTRPYQQHVFGQLLPPVQHNLTYFEHLRTQCAPMLYFCISINLCLPIIWACAEWLVKKQENKMLAWMRIAALARRHLESLRSHNATGNDSDVTQGGDNAHVSYHRPTINDGLGVSMTEEISEEFRHLDAYADNCVHSTFAISDESENDEDGIYYQTVTEVFDRNNPYHPSQNTQSASTSSSRTEHCSARSHDSSCDSKESLLLCDRPQRVSSNDNIESFEMSQI